MCRVIMKPQLALSLAALLLPLSAAGADEPSASRELGVETGISFPSDSTLRDYQADGDRGIWIQDRRRDWYYGEFLGTCPSLNFARAIGVETRGSARLDKYATILVRGDSCALKSFVTSAPPPSKEERKAAAAAAKAGKSN